MSSTKFYFKELAVKSLKKELPLRGQSLVRSKSQERKVEGYGYFKIVDKATGETIAKDATPALIQRAKEIKSTFKK